MSSCCDRLVVTSSPSVVSINGPPCRAGVWFILGLAGSVEVPLLSSRSWDGGVGSNLCNRLVVTCSSSSVVVVKGPCRAADTVERPLFSSRCRVAVVAVGGVGSKRLTPVEAAGSSSSLLRDRANVRFVSTSGSGVPSSGLVDLPFVCLVDISFVLQVVEPRKAFDWCNHKYPFTGFKIQGSDRSLNPDRWSFLRCVDVIHLDVDGDATPFKVNTLRLLVLSHDAASTIAGSQYNLCSSVAKALKEGVDYYISGPIEEYKICTGSLYLEFNCRKGDDKRLETFAKGTGATLRMKKLQEVTVAVSPPLSYQGCELETMVKLFSAYFQ